MKKILHADAVVWKNGKPIDWTSTGLRLSRMLPNGCDTTFCTGQLAKLHRAVDSILRPYWGHPGWEREAPVGAVLITKLINVVDMYSSCYCYGTMFFGSRYYNDYLAELDALGATTHEESVKEIAALVRIFGDYFRAHAKIHYNVANDDGCQMNGMSMDEARLNVRIAG